MKKFLASALALIMVFSLLTGSPVRTLAETAEGSQWGEENAGGTLVSPEEGAYIRWRESNQIFVGADEDGNVIFDEVEIPDEDERRPAEYDNTGYTDEDAPEQIVRDEDNLRFIYNIEEKLTENTENPTMNLWNFAVNQKLQDTPPTIERTEDPNRNGYFVSRSDATVPVNVTPAPGYAEYNLDVEVGRTIFIPAMYPAMNEGSSSDTSIMSRPEWYKNVDGVYYFITKAHKPGDVKLTCYNSKENMTEVWNVHVYCRDLSFEQDSYVVQKKGKYGQFADLKLKNFEYSVEFAYYFAWTSSNPDVALVSNDFMGTECTVTIKKPGATLITVADKFGNSRSTLLVVKPDPDLVKEEINESKVKLTAKSGKGYVKLNWEPESSKLDGYQIKYSTSGKSYKSLKTIKAEDTRSYKFTAGKNKKTYYFKVRGYKLVDGKKVYTKWSTAVSKLFKNK